MKHTKTSLVILTIALLTLLTQRSHAQASGYIGYTLDQHGDPESTIYETDETDTAVVNGTAPPPSVIATPPDVYLNASVHIGEIDIEVSNLTAKINLAAQVLSLLNFNAGVDASIDRVYLTIQNVTAKVLLEARLENLVTMIDDVLHSLDLNPLLATLGQDVGQIVNSTLGGGGSGSSTSASASPTPSSSSATKRTALHQARSLNTHTTEDQEIFTLAQNILYSINNYSGNTHTNRILTQTGTVVDEMLDNDGNVHGTRIVGSYTSLMHSTGHNSTVTYKGHEGVHELEYKYAPFPGLNIISAVYLDGSSGDVLGTQVLAESSAGGSSTISDGQY
jgi:hypothetical protein